MKFLKKKDNGNLLFDSAINAGATFVYTAAVASILFYGETLFGKSEDFLVPVAVLMLLVLSAAVAGSLVFAKPVILYLDGKKKDAIQLLFFTIGWLFVFTFLVLIIKFVINY